MEKEHSQQFLKRRGFLTFLPALVIPFIVILFWLRGGGKGTAASSTDVKAGLNTQLPDANLKAGSPVDKLSFLPCGRCGLGEKGESFKNGSEL